MEKIKLITDTACDIPKDAAEKLGIQVLSIPITIGDQGYMEGQDFTNEEFYNILLESKTVPCTSHIPAPMFREIFEQAYNDGFNRIICATINSKGSSMFQAATLAANTFAEEHADDDAKICVLDSKTYTMAYGLPLMAAAQSILDGASYDKVVADLKTAFNSMEIAFTIFNLDFAKKSGRISAAAALVGGVLGLRPLLTFVDGENKIAGKYRGDKTAINEMIKYTLDRIPDKSKPYCVAHGLEADAAREVAEILTAELGHPPVCIYPVGASIAINAGPRLVGIIFEGENKA